MARFYRTVFVDAVQWTGDNADEVERLAGADYETWLPANRTVEVHTWGGLEVVPEDYWVTRDKHGGLDVWAASAFDANFRPVPETPAFPAPKR